MFNIKPKIMKAQCTQCGVNYGCGCQLTNGLCSSCLNSKNNKK